MNTELRQITMNMLKETVNFSECILKKCNNEKKEFMASDVHAKYTEIFNKIETHADRKKIINLLIPSDKYLNIAKCKYNKCFGTRQEVWNGDAYKTTGELTKSAFIINKNGKIVSKTKFIQEKEFNRFEQVNLMKKELVIK